jgi:4-amino-4-deoxy-L-arabinose transferase-like glycosyltransferase
MLCSLLFVNQILPSHWMVFGLIEVIAFFIFSNQLTQNWKSISIQIFIKKIFTTALIIRVVYVLFSYFFYEYMTGIPFEFTTADANGYHEEATWINELYKNQDFLNKYPDYIKGNYSDAGYPVYLSIIYFISDNSILFARIIKAILSAYTCILIYKICRNNFGESTGRIAGIISIFFPSFIYYCGLHVKETEMIFVLTFFIERISAILISKKISYPSLIVGITLAFLLFFFRTVLGVSAFFALFSALLLTQNKFMQSSKKIVIGIWVVLTLFIFLGGTLIGEMERLWGEKGTNQRRSMEARAALNTGNKFAKYGASALFAPFILVAPFPTMVNVETQQNQMMLHGGFYVKNILGFFVLLAIIVLIRRKEYKKHIFILSFLLVYLGILTLSKFAISERFHMPAYPILIVLTAYGISKLDLKNSKYYIPYLILIGIIIIGWNWFKLAGRGSV